MKCPACQKDMLGLNGPPVCPNCDRERIALGPSDETACSPSSVAIIRRKEYPQNYIGHNDHGPMWSSSLASAKRIPAAEVQIIINVMAANGQHAWGEIHPEND